MKLKVSHYTLGVKNNRTSDTNLGFGKKVNPPTSKLLSVLRRSEEPIENHQSMKTVNSNIKSFFLKFAGITGLGLICALGTAGLGGFAGKEMTKNHITINDVLSKAKTNLNKIF